MNYLEILLNIKFGKNKGNMTNYQIIFEKNNDTGPCYIYLLLKYIDITNSINMNFTIS